MRLILREAFINLILIWYWLIVRIIYHWFLIWRKVLKILFVINLHRCLLIKSFLIFLPSTLILNDINLLSQHGFAILINPNCILHLFFHYLFLVLKFPLHFVHSLLMCLLLIIVSKFWYFLVLFQFHLI